MPDPPPHTHTAEAPPDVTPKGRPDFVALGLKKVKRGDGACSVWWGLNLVEHDPVNRPWTFLDCFFVSLPNKKCIHVDFVGRAIFYWNQPNVSFLSTQQKTQR